MHLLSGFKEFTINFISRKDNRGADKLANLVVKNQLKKFFDRTEGGGYP